MALVRTTIEIDDALWRIVRIRVGRESITTPEALEQILRDFIKDHGKEYGYPAEQIEGR